jgi:hypothetical protein
MPDIFASRNDLGLIRSPGPRQRAARRRLYVLAGFIGLVLVSGALGAFADRHDTAFGKPQTGPFSYFPSE